MYTCMWSMRLFQCIHVVCNDITHPLLLLFVYILHTALIVLWEKEYKHYIQVIDVHVHRKSKGSTRLLGDPHNHSMIPKYTKQITSSTLQCTIY